MRRIRIHPAQAGAAVVLGALCIALFALGQVAIGAALIGVLAVTLLPAVAGRGPDA